MTEPMQVVDMTTAAALGDSLVVVVVFAVIFGASCGAIVGLIIARLLRFCAYLAGKNFEGNFMVLLGAITGGALLVWLAVTRTHF
ncbi:MAG: hypothetical protein QOF48_3947 [Verrucomicrobiota bacterium]|jgi:hypothetical protein